MLKQLCCMLLKKHETDIDTDCHTKLDIMYYSNQLCSPNRTYWYRICTSLSAMVHMWEKISENNSAGNYIQGFEHNFLKDYIMKHFIGKGQNAVLSLHFVNLSYNKLTWRILLLFVKNQAKKRNTLLTIIELRRQLCNETTWRRNASFYKIKWEDNLCFIIKEPKWGFHQRNKH